MTMNQNNLSVSDAPYQQGLRHSSNLVVNSAGTSTSFSVWQVIEGYNAQDLNWGTSFGSPVTFSFWVKASITGNYTFHIISSGTNASYLAPYTVVNPNTWEYKTLTIPPPPNGSTWGTNTNAWGYVQFRFTQPGASTGSTGWGSGVLQKLYGTVNLIDVQGATWAITGVQLEKGTVATPFEFRPFATELTLCQRYYYQVSAALSASHVLGTGYAGGTTTAYINIPHPVTMRASPTAISNSAVGTFQIGYLGTATPVTAIAAGALGPYNSALTITTAAVLTGGQGVNMTAVSTSAFLGFNAEL
jgi:hypothetical protein